MNTRIAAAVTTIVAALGGGVWAQQPSVTLSPAALKEIAEVEAEIDHIGARQGRALHRKSPRRRGSQGGRIRDRIIFLKLERCL
jgi:hypothetical protein